MISEKTIAFKYFNMNNKRIHEVTIKLRNLKKEDQKLRRRKLNEEDLTSSLKKIADQLLTGLSIDEIVIAMKSEDPDRQLLGMKQAKKMLLRPNPPINLMIEHRIVPIYIHFIQNASNILQLQAGWALDIITSGKPEHSRCVLDQGAVPHLVNLLQSDCMSLVEHAVSALANIASVGAAARNVVIENNVIDSILPLIDFERPFTLLHKIAILMSNLCKFPLQHSFDHLRLMDGLENIISLKHFDNKEDTGDDDARQ